jgi:hypothetical protein
MGICYDLFFAILRLKNKSLCAAAAAYLNYILFALLMAYVIRYEYWAQAGAGKVLNHVLVSGSIAALVCALLVPLGYRIGDRLKKSHSMPFAPSRRLVPGGVSLAAVGLWVFGVAAYLFS